MRKPFVRATSSTPFGGVIRQARWAEECDLVGAGEARARLGEGATSDVLRRLARRCARGLAPGQSEWLVDITALATPDPDADLSVGAAVVVESGDRL